MVITLTLPDNLAQALQTQAEIQRLNMLDLITVLLKQSLNLEPQDELMQLIQEIKAPPPFAPPRGLYNKPYKIPPPTLSLI